MDLKRGGSTVHCTYFFLLFPFLSKYYLNLRVGRSREPLLQIKACWGLLLIPWVFPLPIHVPWHLPSLYLRLSLKYLGLFLTHSFLMHWEFPSPYMYLFKLCADILGFLSGLYRRLSWLHIPWDFPCTAVSLP